MDEVYTLDLRGVKCPFNFVKTKIKLEDLEPGDFLEVLLDHGEPAQSVPRSIIYEGHNVICEKGLPGYYRVVVEKVS